MYEDYLVYQFVIGIQSLNITVAYNMQMGIFFWVLIGKNNVGHYAGHGID